MKSNETLMILLPASAAASKKTSCERVGTSPIAMRIATLVMTIVIVAAILGCIGQDGERAIIRNCLGMM